MGRDMAQVGFKFGARQQPVTKTRRNKVMVAKREKGERLNLVVARLNLTAFLKDPEGCPLDHRYVPIRALRTNFELLSIHIGSVSTIQPEQMIKKTGSTTGSTVVPCYYRAWVSMEYRFVAFFYQRLVTVKTLE